MDGSILCASNPLGKNKLCHFLQFFFFFAKKKPQSRLYPEAGNDISEVIVRK